AILGPLPPVRQPLRIAAALRGETVEWLRRLLCSVEALGLDLFDGATRPTAWLASPAPHSSLPPSTAGSAAFGFVLQVLAHRHGWPYPRGGMGRLADALVARLTRAGAAIRCDAPVAAILVRGGRAAGVRLADGEELAADAVLTT